jgi:hypothetical protein
MIRLLFPGLLGLSSLLLVGCDGSVAGPPTYQHASPVWVEVPPLAEARCTHAAVELPDGRVLVVGGARESSLGSAEIFDPAAGIWKHAAPMKQARAYPTATLLQDGRVLVAGGADLLPMAQPVYLDTAEIYDPAADVWTDAPKMARAHPAATATLLPSSGKVLVVGGRDKDQKSYLDIAELFDPAAGKWQLLAPTKQAQHAHRAVLLPDERVVLVGGYDAEGPLDSCEVFDPQVGSFQELPSMSLPRRGPAAALLPSGDILVAGGEQGAHQVARSVEILDPVSQTWALGRAMSDARTEAQMVVYEGGEAVVLGGHYFYTSVPNPPYSVLATVESRDPQDGTWSALPPMKTARSVFTATRLQGAVLVAGGLGDGQAPIGAAELFYRNGACASGLDCSPGKVCAPQGYCAEPLAVSP